MASNNVALVRRWFEGIWNLRDETVIDELLTDQSVCQTDEGPIRGPREFRERQYRPFIAAFPGLRVEVEAMISEGDDVAVRWVATGCHEGDGLGCKPTHETATFRGLSWIKVVDGKMIEGWQSSNIAEVVRGLASRASA